MSQVEYSLHHCYQQVNDLLARYNSRTQAEQNSPRFLRKVWKKQDGGSGEENLCIIIDLLYWRVQ